MKYDSETLKLISLFEKITRSNLKDIIPYKESYIFIVEPGQLRKALGKENVNLKKIQEALGKRIKIVEFNKDVKTFIKNLVYPLKVTEVTQDEYTLVVKGADHKTRGLMIGAKAQNLRFYESIVKNYFPEVEEVKVVE